MGLGMTCGIAGQARNDGKRCGQARNDGVRCGRVMQGRGAHCAPTSAHTYPTSVSRLPDSGRAMRAPTMQHVGLRAGPAMIR